MSAFAHALAHAPSLDDDPGPDTQPAAEPVAHRGGFWLVGQAVRGEIPLEARSEAVLRSLMTQCADRIANAKAMRWRTLAESWQRDYDGLKAALEAARRRAHRGA